MTTDIRSEAAERLYLLFANHKDATDSQWLEADFLLTEALAAERRATVEFLRHQPFGTLMRDGIEWVRMDEVVRVLNKANR